MTKWLRETEAKIRRLCADNNICDPKELASFTETNNLELEIEKRDGSRVRILKRLIARCEKDPVAKVELLGKLKRGFKRPKQG